MATLVLLCALTAARGAAEPCAGAGASAAPHRDVLTSAGAARGYLALRPPHYAFLGLPYARAPSARARFKGPETPVPWSGVLEATQRARCAQPGRRGRRNAACLVLNVFAPECSASKPVLVHLHAGHFVSGWGLHTAPSRLLSQGFVVVTLNFRLGAEGFLCLGTGGAPGNAGLKDQVAALAWVHANIARFGGEPAHVTLYGTGAGAAAAELLLLSGAIDGFVQRVILESGSALAPTSLATDPVASALQVAISLGYEDGETKTNDDLTKFYQDIRIEKTLNFSSKFAPCVEDNTAYSALLIKDPKLILQSKAFKPVPLLIVHSKELSSLNNDNMFQSVPNNFDELLPNNLEFESEDIKYKIGEQVKESYFGELETGGSMVEGFESYVNDVFTAYPIVKSATMHAAVSSLPVYLMEILPRDGSDTVFEYIFGIEPFSNQEELVAKKLLTLWCNFMIYSDPTPLKTSLLPVVWLPVTFSNKIDKPDISTATCLVFDLRHMTMSMGTPSSRHTLPIWDHIYDNFYKWQSPPEETLESEVTLYDEELALFSTLRQQKTENEEGEEEPEVNDEDDYDAEQNNVSEGYNDAGL